MGATPPKSARPSLNSLRFRTEGAATNRVILKYTVLFHVVKFGGRDQEVVNCILNGSEFSELLFEFYC